MAQASDFLLMLIVLLGLTTLGASRVAGSIRIVALQGIVLGIALIVSHAGDISVGLLFLAAVNIALKGLLMPWLLFRSMREAKVQREVRPYIGFMSSLALGAVSIGIAFGIGNALPLPKETVSSLVVPVSLATVFIGLLLLVSRRIAVTQVVGYLVLENGIFVFSLAFAPDLPTTVEMGVLLDVFVGVFIMGITIFQINREFDHMDASRLRELQDTAGGRRRLRVVAPSNGAADEGR